MKKLLSILLAGTLMAGCSAPKENTFEYEQGKTYESYEYVVTETNGIEFWGDSTENDGGIFFDNTVTHSNHEIEVGDTVVAMFEGKEHDSLIEVFEK